MTVLVENRGQVIKELLKIRERREREDIHHLILLVLMILIRTPIHLIVALVLTLIHQILVHPAVLDTRGEREHQEKRKIGMEKAREIIIQINDKEGMIKNQLASQNGVFVHVRFNTF